MRPIVKSIRYRAPNIPLEFSDWKDAKVDLTNEIGSFCSYCEKYNSRSALHVEHIYGRKCKDATGNLIYDHLKGRWDNFLLACVNCNAVKKNKDVAVLNPYLPHTNNLLHFIEVLTGGIIQIKPEVTGIDRIRTKAFIDLIGLDRLPDHPEYSDKDDRWDNRLKVFDIAERQYKKYTEPVPSTNLDAIIELARTNGYFSVWYTVFNAFEEVKLALINGITTSDGLVLVAFPGTDSKSFDIDNHYSTLSRPPIQS
ncbi:hypothetical protein SAMN05518672_103786 [Chitinophaga sp. CF118]|uniref:hypothetical protein n=1 Tax=Chitinophaga sp. CF118 TaxID=1884367 RepID=UPI0008F0B01A|nr:hypothetical protein [Chitinophaga sp. CF118]SFD90432.1 hypothetical protein SAMN05518672_103786 [Chitinophaga sp. CF118]